MPSIIMGIVDMSHHHHRRRRRRRRLGVPYGDTVSIP